MSHRINRFAQNMRDRQLSWALDGNIPVAALESRHGKLSWVLKREYQKLNLFRPEWWDYIADAEHRWARALNSSQCFAVNIFAPLVEDTQCARRVLQALLPNRAVGIQDSVSIAFEFTPEGAPVWLGERGQATQIDVYFRIARPGRCTGHVLVEVKFTEASFGCCRGWRPRTQGPIENPNPSRCLNAPAILLSPKTNCWLAEVEGRKYWDIIADPQGSIQASAIRSEGPCPFRGGLYQLMRNRVLADELIRRTEARWADFAVCRHPSNEMVLGLKEPVCSTHNAIEAFRALSFQEAVLDWNAKELVGLIASADDRLKNWEIWMIERYFRECELPKEA